MLTSFLITHHSLTRQLLRRPYPMRATRCLTYCAACPIPRGNMALLSGSTSATLGGSWRTAVPEGFRSERADRNMAPAASMKSEWFTLLHWNKRTTRMKSLDVDPHWTRKELERKKISSSSRYSINYQDKNRYRRNYLHRFSTYKSSTRISPCFPSFSNLVQILPYLSELTYTSPKGSSFFCQVSSNIIPIISCSLRTHLFHYYPLSCRIPLYFSWLQQPAS